MEIGVSLGVSGREDINRVGRLARAAEDASVSAAWVIDSQLAMKDAYLALGVLATQTRTIHLGPGVTNLATRHITVVANAMATLAAFAPGRVLVGVGAGDSSVIPLGQRPHSVAQLEAGISQLRTLLTGGAIDGPKGDVRLSFTPDPAPPIYVAASQPRMLELAGRVADGVIVMGPADAGSVREQMAHVELGARRANRDPATVFRDLWVTLAVGDPSVAVQDVKSWASAQARWLAAWRQVPPALERFRPEMEVARDRYDFASHLARSARHADDVSDEFARALAVVGPVEVCARRLQELAVAGADRITVTLLSGGRERRLNDLLIVRDLVDRAATT